MSCTQQELDAARAEGVQQALAAIDDELARAMKEVKLSNAPNTTFAASNRDRAILRVNVIKQVRARVAAL